MYKEKLKKIMTLVLLTLSIILFICIFFQNNNIQSDNDELKLHYVAAMFIVLYAVVMFLFNIIWLKNNNDTFLPKNEKNSSIEALRFFIIMCVVVHHYCGFTPAGYLGVDFFFILSGCFLMQHYMMKDNNVESAAISAYLYSKGRYFRLIPHYLFAYSLSLCLSVCFCKKISLLSLLKNDIWELLMLDALGFNESLVVGPGWYCSALIIAGFFAYYFLARSPKTYLYFIAPVSFCFILSWMYRNIGHVNRWLQVDTFICTGTLRGFAEIGLGCICYAVYSSLKGKQNVYLGIISTILELVCFSYIVYVIFKVGESTEDFVCILLMAVLITSLFTGHSLWFKILNNKLSNYLGSISIGIYLNHAILQGINWYGIFSQYGLSWYQSSLIYLLVIILFSAISTRFVNSIVSLYKQNK